MTEATEINIEEINVDDLAHKTDFELEIDDGRFFVLPAIRTAGQFIKKQDAVKKACKLVIGEGELQPILNALNESKEVEAAVMTAFLDDSFIRNKDGENEPCPNIEDFNLTHYTEITGEISARIISLQAEVVLAEKKSSQKVLKATKQMTQIYKNSIDTPTEA